MSNSNTPENAFKKADLILSYLEGKLTEEEKKDLDTWLSQDVSNQLFLESLENGTLPETEYQFFSSTDINSGLEKVKQGIKQQQSQGVRGFTTWLKYAAAIVLVFSFGLIGYQYTPLKKNSATGLSNSVTAKKDVLPGRDKAKLELADGRILLLDDNKKASVKINGATIDGKNGIIVYAHPALNSEPKVAYNKISTPKGGKYQIVLSDGTKIWLNAESSLRFPTSFSDKERNVELTGEAYFEVTKRNHKPFKVLVKDVTVEVLGTHFNIMSYGDEKAIRTTLLEGSIKVTKGAVSRYIIPGQQVEIKDNINLIDAANVQEAIAWKTDLFEFNNTDFGTIIRQLERWYNVKIEFDPELEKKHFTGSISRNANLSKVLEMLEQASGVHFKMEERRILAFE